jgi:hypothetical protein
MTQQAPSTDWRPSNDVENRLVAALNRNDRQEFFTVVMAAPLYLPLAIADPTTVDNADPEDYLTFVSGEVTYLLMFTSLETLQAVVGEVANGYVESDYATVRSSLAGSELFLGINLGTPIDAWIDVESVAKAAAGDIVVPTGLEMAQIMELTDPANAEAVEGAAEQELENYVADYIDKLVDGDVLVPADSGVWRITPVDGVPTVVAYSSAETVPPGTPTVSVPFLDVVSGWPAAAQQLSVNPDTPLAFTMPAAMLAVFAHQIDQSNPN